MEELKTQETAGQEMAIREPSMPQRLAPVETTTTTEPEKLSGDTYTYTHYQNTITLVCETRVYNQATNDYSYDYAEDETLFVHVDYENDLSLEQVVEQIKHSALVVRGSAEKVTLEDLTSYSREYTGGYRLSVYDSEGWLIDRQIQEIRDNSDTVIIGAEGEGYNPNSSGIPYDGLFVRVWNPSAQKYEIRDKHGNFLAFEEPLSENKIQQFYEYGRHGYRIGKLTYKIGNRILERSTGPGMLEKIITKLAPYFGVKTGLQTLLKCVRFAGIAGVVWTVIDYGTWLTTYIFSDDPKMMSDIICDAIGDIMSGINNGSPQTHGGGSGGSGEYGYTWDISNNFISIQPYNNISSGIITGVTGCPKYSVEILEADFQVNTTSYNPIKKRYEYKVTMYKTFPRTGADEFIYDSPSLAVESIEIPNEINGQSNVGIYYVWFNIYEQGWCGAVAHGRKEFYLGDTITTTPQT